MLVLTANIIQTTIVEVPLKILFYTLNQSFNIACVIYKNVVKLVILVNYDFLA